MKVGLIGSGFMGKAHAFGFATAERVFDLQWQSQTHALCP